MPRDFTAFVAKTAPSLAVFRQPEHREQHVPGHPLRERRGQAAVSVGGLPDRQPCRPADRWRGERSSLRPASFRSSLASCKSPLVAERSACVTAGGWQRRAAGGQKLSTTYSCHDLLLSTPHQRSYQRYRSDYCVGFHVAHSPVFRAHNDLTPADTTLAVWPRRGGAGGDGCSVSGHLRLEYHRHFGCLVPKLQVIYSYQWRSSCAICLECSTASVH